jgi:hypothetical protein
VIIAAECFINAKVLEPSRDHWFGDQVALEAIYNRSSGNAVTGSTTHQSPCHY